MTAELIIIPSDMSKPVTREPMDRLPAFSVLQEKLGIPKGYVERVNVLWQGERRNLFVHEEGRLHGFPLNPRATAIYHNATHAQFSEPLYADLDADPFPLDPELPPIVGDVAFWTGDPI